MTHLESGTFGVGSSAFTVSDFLRMAGQRSRSVVIEIATGEDRGRIVIECGQLVSAVDRQGVGRAALRRLLATVRPDIFCRALSNEDMKERNLSGSCEELLVESARSA